MSTIIKQFFKIVYHGTKILYNTLMRSISEEVQLSNELARLRYEQNGKSAPSIAGGMTLEEAMRILNVTALDRTEIDRNYKHLFEANEPSQGGSFYIRSKVVMAKERVDFELGRPDDGLGDA